MNCREFEGFVQEHLEGDDSGRHEASVWSLPAPLIVHAGDCPACAQFYAEVRWLLEQSADLPAPSPSGDFANRVVTEVRQSRAWSARPSRAVLRRVSRWSLAAAAAVVLILQFAGPRPAPPTSNPSTPVAVVSATPTVPETLPLPNPDALGPTLASAEELLPTPAIGKAVLASTATFMNAGKEVGGGIQPITASAIGAFDFLWKDLPNPAGKPSS